MTEQGRVEHLNPEGLPQNPAFEVFQRVWGRRPNPPAITVAVVPR
jgi:hypothetical protein